jgi:hypothetical protein
LGSPKSNLALGVYGETGGSSQNFQSYHKEAMMARTSWFDQQSNELKFSQYMEKMESWQRALADGVVKPEEVRQQAERVADMLRALEPKLSDELHQELTSAFYELAVLYGLQRLAEMAYEEGGQK